MNDRINNPFWMNTFKTSVSAEDPRSPRETVPTKEVEVLDLGLLGRRNEQLMGRSFAINPGQAVGGEVLSIRDVGETISLSSLHQYSNKHSIITITAQPVGGNALVPNVIMTGLKALLMFTSGNSLFGSQQDPILIPGLGGLVVDPDPYIKIDCDNCVITLPSASNFILKFKHYAMSNAVGGFVAGQDFGPRYRVNTSYSYGTPKSIQSWYSDVPTLMYSDSPNFPVLPVNAVWPKPQFAEALTINVTINGGAPTLSGLGGLIDVFFYNVMGEIIKSVVYYAPFANFPLIQWPQEAAYLLIHTQGLSGNVGGVYIRPIHAIRL